MERNFTNENFERFLRQNADGLRMRPSDKVWKGIDKQLNRKKRRTAFLLGFGLLLTSGLGYLAIENQGGAEPKDTSRTMLPKASVTNPIRNAGQVASGSKAGNSSPDISAIDRSRNSNGNIQDAPTTSLAPVIALNSRFDQPVNPLITNTQDEQKEGLQTAFEGTIVDDYPSDEKQLPEAASDLMEEKKQVLPLTIESVTNSFQPKRSKKLGVQFFLTPTVSYRRLSENKEFTRTPGNTIQHNIYNINNAVTHKPDLGFQIGVLAKYPLNENFKLRGGVQFNVNRYDIKTFNSSYEIATITFRNDQDMNAVTGYNNFSGYKSDWLENFYFQFAIPVGVEMKISGNEKTHLGIATTIQPTYLLSDRAYLISKDYKNYMEVPGLVRHWNVNAGVETFVSYSSGKTQWQVGPQVRYQLLSSYEKKYAVKEHLFDFGLKVGVSLNNK